MRSSLAFPLYPEKQILECQAAIRLFPKPPALKPIEFGKGVAGWVLKEGKPLLLNGEVEGKKFEKFHQEGQSDQVAMCIPLRLAERTIGVVNVNRLNSGAEFDQDDLQILTIFADNAAVAIEKLDF